MTIKLRLAQRAAIIARVSPRLGAIVAAGTGITVSLSSNVYTVSIDTAYFAANYQALDADLTALAALSTTGIVVRTGTATYSLRTLTGTSAEITVTNGDGVSGAPVFSLPAALTFTGKTVTGGTFSGPALTSPTISGTIAGSPTASGAWSFTDTVTVTKAGAAGVVLLSGAVGSFAAISLGRTSTEINFGVAGVSGNFATGTAAGDAAVQATNNLFLAANGGTVAIKLATTGITTLPGSFTVPGSSSGTASITAQAAAGTPTLTLPNASGTFAVSVSAPLALSATTGNLTITGAAGQVLAGATPAFTATPTLGASGTLGSIAFGNATSGLITLQPVTGALGTVTLSLPAATDTLVGKATTDELTNKTLTTAVGKGTWTASGTWTLPAFTLGGTVSGGGNQLNNVIIGTSTPLAGAFTTLSATGTLTGAAANFSGTITFGTGTVTALTADATPDSAADYLLTYDASAAAFKKSLISSVVGAAAAGVTSIAGNTGAFTLTGGITNSTNAIQIDGAFGFRNRVINPSGYVQQGTAGAVSDGSYSSFDQWILLTQTGTVADSQLTNVENGTPYMMRATQSQASAQRYGWIQWFEKLNCIDLRGEAVTFSLRARLSTTSHLRMAIIEWTGTADTITKDIVNDWTSSTYTTGNFFTTTSTTVSGVSSSITSADSSTLATLSLTATIGSSANNIAVFVWTEGTAAQNATFDIGKVQLEIGSNATKIARRSYQDELRLCQRYFEVENFDGSGANPVIALGQAISTSATYGAFVYSDKRIAPTITTAGTFKAWTAGAAPAAGTIGFDAIGVRRARISMTAVAASPLVAGNASHIVSTTASDSITANARL